MSMKSNEQNISLQSRNNETDTNHETMNKDITINSCTVKYYSAC